jgi:phosphatidylserine/phosphatidylglycerophosphate/cardiolipin synthase-like enzyme
MPLVDRLDEIVGDRVEAATRGHHRRRLRRLGSPALAASDSTPWASDDYPARDGNSMIVHVDGAAALTAIAATLEAARSHVHISGWHTSPDFRLTRNPDGPLLRDLLADLADRLPVRLLMWAGPPVPLFQPTRKMAEAARDEFSRDSRIACVLDARERSLHCHHEKVIVVDDEVAFVGGIDMTALSGDRYDDTSHRPRGALGWHDGAVELRGPAVADVASHFAARWTEVAQEAITPPAPPPPAGDVTVQLTRTVPENTYRFAPSGKFGIAETYLKALRRAERLVYLENQFLWSTEVVDLLCEKLRNPPRDDFRVLLVLPSRPNNGADTTRGQLGRLLAAGPDRVLATTIYSHEENRTSRLYVHAKIAVIDDEWLTLGSANLNEHSLFNDTEVNIATCDRALARQTRLQLWAEHLQRPADQVAGDPARVIDSLWRPIAEEQLHRAESGQPATHRLRMLPGVSRRSERLQGPLRGLLVDG